MTVDVSATVDLGAPLAWKSAEGAAATMLDELQANIVKAHVRDHLSLQFLRFADQDEARTFLGALVPLMKSARGHLEEIEGFRSTGRPGTPYVGVGLTHAGYAALGVPVDGRPEDPSFARGMRDPESKATLGDPPVSTWDPAFRDEIHAVVLVGDAREAPAVARRNEVEAMIPASITIVGEETGRAQRNEADDGVEHFGYVDGRSQPLFLVEDIDDERRATEGTTSWDPAFPLEQVLVADRAAPDPDLHFGSYFIFRKLEQNVRRFKESEEQLATDLGLEDEDRERAGAMLVGRFEDGTPLTLQRAPGTHEPVMNDFTYASDQAGAKCPFHAHIRKVNPRGSGGFEDPADERKHLMARRGQTYGDRFDDLSAGLPPTSRPTGDVGLLFMAFNADIGQQFDFTQGTWANNPNFPAVPSGGAEPGIDQIIGHGPRPEITGAVEWGGAEVKATDAVAEAVDMRGGEYFFMPSLAFLRSL
jgi:Dyp-type peroxidase family